MPEPIAAISTLFTYFNPSRSPYYTIGLAACFAVTFVCDVKGDGMWLALAIPAFLVAALTFALSLDGANTLKVEEQAEQLRFARSTCISVAVLALALAGKQIADQRATGWFVANLVICCFQILLFLVYHWALNREDVTLKDSRHNYVQITLLTSAFLGDTSYNMSVAADHSDTGNMHHAWTTCAIGLLWLSCTLFWILKLAKIVGRPGNLQQIQRGGEVEQVSSSDDISRGAVAASDRH